jgi:hypothetical protein
MMVPNQWLTVAPVVIMEEVNSNGHARSWSCARIGWLRRCMQGRIAIGEKLALPKETAQPGKSKFSRRRVMTAAAAGVAAASAAGPILAQTTGTPNLRFFNPETLPKPPGGYSYVIEVQSTEIGRAFVYLFVDGQRAAFLIQQVSIAAHAEVQPVPRERSIKCKKARLRFFP